MYVCIYIYMNSHNIGPTYVYIGAPSICLCCARAGKAEHAPNASKSSARVYWQRRQEHANTERQATQRRCARTHVPLSVARSRLWLKVAFPGENIYHPWLHKHALRCVGDVCCVHLLSAVCYLEQSEEELFQMCVDFLDCVYFDLDAIEATAPREMTQRKMLKLR